MESGFPSPVPVLLYYCHAPSRWATLETAMEYILAIDTEAGPLYWDGHTWIFAIEKAAVMREHDLASAMYLASRGTTLDGTGTATYYGMRRLTPDGKEI